MCMESKNGEYVSSLREGMSARELRQRIVCFLESEVSVRGVGGETVNWKEIDNIFSGSQETCPKKNQIEA